MTDVVHGEGCSCEETAQLMGAWPSWCPDSGAPEYAEIGADRIEMMAVTGRWDDLTTVRTTRYVGVVRVRRGDGEPVAVDRCEHSRPVHPHRTPAEALECARGLAEARHPRAVITVAEDDA